VLSWSFSTGEGSQLSRGAGPGAARGSACRRYWAWILYRLGLEKTARIAVPLQKTPFFSHYLIDKVQRLS
jgi:hypothetical protein